MSNYFRTLERLKRAGTAAPVTKNVPEVLVEELRAPDSTAPAGLPFREMHLSMHAAAYATLLDSLRALVTSAEAPRVVLAPVSNLEPVEPVLEGLLMQSRERGVRLVLGALAVSQGRRVLTIDSLSTEGEPVPPLTLGGVRSSEDRGLKEWLNSAVTDQDLIVVQAPPLSSSVEALLLTKICDGLLIVAQSGVTAREDLCGAVEKAEAAGCRVLGLVMTGASGKLPQWLRSLLPIS